MQREECSMKAVGALTHGVSYVKTSSSLPMGRT